MKTHSHTASLVWLAALLWSLCAAFPALAQVRTLPDFTELVEQVGPSVVNIRTMAKISRSSPLGPEYDQDMFEFFRHFGLPVPALPRPSPRQGPQRRQDEEQPRGVGSGFIISADGVIMTNAHVIDDADEVYVTLPDKREFKARVVGADKRTDVAVVKIDASGLPAVRIGDVGRLKVGEWVMAIGSPFGLDNTVTAGIVSAKQRDTGDYLPFIQTDVAINPGNSGGPLINMRGEVVGINSQIYSRSGGSMGISFSIPIDEAMRVSDQLRQHGRVSRGRMGVQIDQVSKDVAESAGLGKPQGALVRSVEEDSPADKAGVEAGDIILRFDGKPVDKASDLPRLVGGTKPGTRSTVTVFRRGTTRDLRVTIAEAESDKGSSRPSDRPRSSKGSNAAEKWGLEVSELTDAQKQELRIKGGVMIDAATDAAAQAGLREGDVILAINNTSVSNVREFDAAMVKAQASRPLPVFFRRGNWAQYTVIRPAR
ncbi:DegQ family serine endoprotease [Candidatus Symbiobacter mobilis]|uniref:Probable periplasmic serine endoprotease DegP-like n=1 Tax=Candidatus Symbiobacter mobilis CR TaxID=946483 RepID=U5NEC8_9BURK|nr:DegQ family serine endoprotease [Candidatus Symbiobacter mobilis]AGX88583.1 trypsin-like serine protease [Candidatus Symbiobacter mobilis CR]